MRTHHGSVIVRLPIVLGLLLVAACDDKQATDDGKVRAEAAKSDAAKSDTKQIDAAKSDAAKSDAKQNDAEKADTTKSDTEKSEANPARPPETETGSGSVIPPKVDPFAALFLSGADGKFSVVDINDADVPDKDKSVDDLAEACDQCDGIESFLDPNNKLLPTAYKIGDPWVVVGAAGPQVGKIRAFGAMGGASTSHYLLVLDGFGADVPSGPAYPGATPANPKAKLVQAKPIRLEASAMAALMKTLASELTRKLEAESRPTLAKHPLTAAHVTVYAPKMPGTAKQLVVVGIPVPDPEDPDGIGNTIAAMAVLDGGGRPTWISEPTLGLESIHVGDFVDLDGDGFDEITFDMSYYEGSFSFIVYWDGTKPSTMGTGGDGA